MAIEATDHALLVEGPSFGDASSEGSLLSSVGDALRAGGAPWAVRRLGGDEAAQYLDESALCDALEAIARCDVRCLLVVMVGAVVRGDDRLGFLVAHGGAAWPMNELTARLSRTRADQIIIVVAVEGEDSVTAAEIVGALKNEAEIAVIAVAHKSRDVIATLIAALRGGARGRAEAMTTARMAAQLATSHAAAVWLPSDRRRDLPWFPGSARDPTPAAADPILGSILPGRFRIDAAIAAGSFGAVYRARQLTVDRDVAVKIIRAGIDPFSQDGRLFVHEIQAVARIDHRNVVRVYQADVTDDGRLFFAMELLPGSDLQATAAEGPIAVERAVALGQQLLAALEAAHRAGIVHADVKPGNAIVVDDNDRQRLVLVDFGLARLRQLDAYVTSVGGTPAFMAPEQLQAGRVDARSDQFSAALVLVALITGWTRRRAVELTPPAAVLASIGDAGVRAALTRALSRAPDDRFPSVAAFAAALAGTVLAPPSRPPFHGLAPFTTDDRGTLYGRDRELARITELVLYRRLVIVTAPSGVGKTSLLRAGVVPRLAALSLDVHYASCRTDDDAALSATLASAAAPPAADERDAARPVVVLVDQIEAALESTAGAPSATGVGAAHLLDAVIARALPRGSVHAVLSVREDFLAWLLDRLPDRGEGAPIVRVGPLDEDGARDAIVRPLAERGLAIDGDLLARLIADLTAAGARLGRELGWATPAPVYPPHLQLACSVLHDGLSVGETTLTLRHYDALGGFDSIVGEHLERVLDELTAGDGAIARELFLALVSSTHLRSARTEGELVDAIGEPHRARLAVVLETLQRQGLVVRTRRADGELVWELIHDSLVPRVLAWVDRHDLSRRRAVELVRYHLRRARPDAPSLLSRAELHEVDDHAGAIAALDAEWRRGHAGGAGSPGWTPAALVARSRQIHRRSTIAGVALIAAVVAGIGAAIAERWQAATERRDEAARRDADLGLVSFELSAHDWDAALGSATPVHIAELPALSWTLFTPSFDNPDEPGDALPPGRFQRFPAQPSSDGLTRRDPAEAPGGAAFLVVDGRGRGGEHCAPSLIPLRRLPGYARRGAGPQVLQIRVPTCQATFAGTIEIPTGPFVFGGLGNPPSKDQADHPERATPQDVTLPAYRIDRTEVTNAAFASFAAMADATGIEPPDYIPNRDLEIARQARAPVSGVTWREANLYCRYLGKRLPSSAEWEKAMRGGKTIDGVDNPSPDRSFPWGTPQASSIANLADEKPPGVRLAGSHPGDRSPYGVLDLAGSVSEWIGSAPTGYTDPAFFIHQRWRVMRGGNWSQTPPEELADYTMLENTRPGDTRSFTIGMRCVIADHAARAVRSDPAGQPLR